jgi:5-methylcytosine-specific restriction endonuclease McrA
MVRLAPLIIRAVHSAAMPSATIPNGVQYDPIKRLTGQAINAYAASASSIKMANHNTRRHPRERNAATVSNRPIKYESAFGDSSVPDPKFSRKRLACSLCSSPISSKRPFKCLLKIGPCSWLATVMLLRSVGELVLDTLV